jgi:pilus assembly protein CpaE
MVVSYIGTKGGTGTTTLAINAAADIRHITGRPTIVIDLKMGPGDVGSFLGLRPTCGLLQAIDGASWLAPSGMNRFVGTHDSGVDVLAGGTDVDRPSARDAEAVSQVVRALTSQYDYVIIDAGAALTTCVRKVVLQSDVVMLVAIPDVPCLRSLQRLVDAVKLAGVASEHLKVVLNRATEFGALSASQIGRELGMTIDYYVDSDYRTIASALNLGAPVSSQRRSLLHDQLDTIARALAVAGEDVETPASLGGP